MRAGHLGGGADHQEGASGHLGGGADHQEGVAGHQEGGDDCPHRQGLTRGRHRRDLSRAVMLFVQGLPNVGVVRDPGLLLLHSALRCHSPIGLHDQAW